MKYKHFALVVLVLLLNACGDNIRPVDLSYESQILYLGNGTEPQDLDPHVVTGVPESKILMALLEGLVIRHPSGLSPLPGIAQRWNISEDGKTYTFFLRDNAIWSNGDQVTANDFVYSWRRMLTPSLGSKYPDMLYDVIGAEDFNKGLLKDFSKVGVRAVDERTLQVSLRNPAPYFLELLCHYTTRPIHRPTIEKFGEIDSLGSQWTRPGNFIGNGPFELSSWELNKLLVVKKSPTYWDAANVTLNEIHFFPVDNATREDLMFRSGKLHVTSTVPQEKIEVYKGKYPENLKIDPYYGTYYYRFNTKKEPFNNKLVRQALSLSIDREKIVQKVQKGGQAVAFSFTPPNRNAFYPSTKLEYDPERAKELLIQAGYPEGTLPPFELLYNTSEGHQKLAQAIQQMWKKNLNIDVTLTNTDWKVYLSKMGIGDFSVARAGWIGDYVDPKSFLDMMVTGRGNNQTGWSNIKYDSLLLKGANSPSQDERFSFFDEAEHILMDELPILPIYTYTRIYMLHSDVEGWDSNLLDNHPYQFLSIRQSVK